MNSDYLILISLGILGIIILLITSPIQFKKAEFWLKINFIFVYIMILIGIIGFILLIFELFY